MSTTIRNNFSLPTLLLVGACLQSLVTLIVPFRYALLPPFAFLVGQVVHTALMSYGYIPNSYMKNARLGKHTAQIPNADGSISQKACDKNVVVFMIGAVSHSPLGIFDPDFRKIGEMFRDMFIDIETEPAKWGFLGTGHQGLDTDGPNGIKTLNVTYWKTIEHLHAFAQTPAHREAWAWWDEYRKQHSEVGIMHETYLSPAGHWETIYENCHPVGLASAKFPVTSSEKDGLANGGMAGCLVEARNVRYNGMANRMGRTSGILAPDQ